MDLPRTVYALQHNVTKKIYIGSSKNVNERYLSHMYKLRNNIHQVEDLQSDYNKYGEDFTVFVLDKIETFQERTKEYDWMLKYNTIAREYGYNYKDHIKLHRIKKNTPIYAEGLPDVPSKPTIEQFQEMISSMSENEIVYYYSLIKKHLDEQRSHTLKHRK